MRRLPEGVRAQPSHEAQRSLNLLDAGLQLAWNDKLKRFEVWRETRDALGPNYGFIIRVTGPDGTGFAEPGEWLMSKLRERDSRYNKPEAALEAVLGDIKAGEAKAAHDDEHRLDSLHEELALDYLPLWRKKADPHDTTKEYKDWDKVPVIFGMGDKS